jgi:hypothetical protein
MSQVIEFPDVSYYQGNIDWLIMKQRTNNVIIRSSQGNWVDNKFYQNYGAAKDKGIFRGVYHFFDGRYSPDEQAATLIKSIKSDLPETRVWVDWERSYGGAFEGVKNVVALMKKVQQALPTIIIGMYVGYYWFVENTNAVRNAVEYSYLESRPLWLSQWTNTGSSDGLLVPKPWEYPPELHQWGTPAWGPAFGVETEEIDMDRVLKNNSIYKPNDTPNPGDDKMIGQVTAGALNIRRLPNSDNTTNPAIGQLKLNDVITADFKANGWWHLQSITRSGSGIALPSADCYSYEGDTQGYIKDITPTSTDIPPQEVIIKDRDGIQWRSTTFTKV